MAQSLSKIISRVDSFEKLTALETNIRNRDALTDDVEREIKEKYAELGRSLVSERTGLELNNLTDAEGKIVQAVARYVGLQKRDGKAADRTFRMLRRRGLIKSAEVSVCKSKPTQGYEVLENADLSELSFEQIIIDHPKEFSERSLWFARRTLNIPNESDKPPASQETLTQKRTEIILDWFTDRLQLKNGVLAGYTNADVGMVLQFDDLSKHGRVLGNITSRIDFACYKCGLPPIGLCAEVSFTHAWEQRDRDWPFPKDSMQLAAQTKRWAEKELEEIRAKTRELPGQASISWNKEFGENEASVKKWAFSFKAEEFDNESSNAIAVEEAAEQERKTLNETPEIKIQVGKTIERGPMGRKVKQANNFKCQICEALGSNPHSFDKPNGEPYVEAHHVTPVSEMQIGSLAADNIMTLCANHHRQIHYGNVTVYIEDILRLPNKAA